jgi:hypothetical protein
MECGFMTKSGCGFTGGSCVAIIEKCEGCNKILESATGRFCKVYPDPIAKWSLGGCPTASHLKKEVKEEQKINPLKASKRSRKG